MPITWKNVDAPSNAGIAQLLSLGSAGINTGFDKLGQILSQRQDIENQNWNQQKANNTAAILAQGNQADTPEAFQASRKALQEQLLGYGAQVDTPAVQNFLNNQTKVLQDRIKAGNEYQDYTTDQSQLGDVSSIKEMIAKGDFAGAKAYLEKVDLRNEGTLWNTLSEKERSDLEYKDRRAAAEDAAKLRPYLHANAVTQQKLLEGELADKDKARKDRLEEDRLSQVLFNKQQEHLDSTRTKGRQMGKVAQNLGYPVTATGLPDIDLMNQSQKNKLFHASTLEGIQDAGSYGLGDTKVANKFYDTLTKSGDFSPATIQRNRDKILSTFNSTLLDGSVGNDATASNKASARNTVAMEEIARNNWSTPNSPDALRNFDELTKLVPTLVGGEDPESVQRTIYKLATKGISLANGERVTPSINDVLSAITSTSDGWGWEGWSLQGGDYGDKIERILSKRMQTEDATKRFKDAETYKAWKLNQDAKKILSK